MTQDKISAAVEQQISVLDPFLLTQKPLLNSLAEHLVATFHQGGRLFLVGSGPFGAIAGIIGQSFLHRQTLERPALPAISLSNDAGLATFLASDEQGSQLFSRQLRALATNQDTILVLAGTNLSQADREALNTAKQLGCRTILISSEQAEIAGSLPNTSLALPSDSLPRLLESTLFIGNLLCTLVEGELFGT
ncbi:SIS domain-containing protein [Deltaproteobacteria bacterium IMCC39524]|nr:SIS domain-containing protein [Deltaproteobacteria bacterium IMCC39524]